jgi:hypothetical protein
VANDTQYWLGTPGNLRRIRPPRRDYPAELDQVGATFRALLGGRTVYRFGIARAWTFSYNEIPLIDWDRLERLYAISPTNLCLLDPEDINLLGRTVSTGTTANPARVLPDYFVTSGALVSITPSVAIPTLDVTRAVRFEPPTASGHSVIGANTSTAATVLANAVPVLPNQPYVFGAYTLLVAQTADARATIRWYDNTGTFLSASAGTTATLSNSAWTWQTVTAAPPANAVLAAPAVEITTTPTSGTQIAVTSWIMRYGSTAQPADWVHGWGCARVAFDTTDKTVPLFGRRSGSYRLLALGAA